MTIMLSRRSLIQAGLSAAGGLMIAAFAPEFAGATTIAGEPWSPETGKSPDEVNAFVVIDPDNFDHAAGRQVRNGPGRPDFDGDDRRRGAGMRLRQGEGRVRLRPSQPRRQQRLPVDGDGRLLLGAPFARVPAAGGRLGPGAAHRRRGGEMGRRARSLRRRRRLRSASKPPGARRPSASSRPTPPKSRSPPSRRSRRPISSSSSARSLRRIDTPLKVTGAARFGIDTRLPGMAYAAAANCPVFGGKLKSYDFSAISGRRGIIAAVPVTNGVAVVADNFWRAKEALNAMPIEWDFGPAASTDSAEFAAEYRAALDRPLADGGGHGDIAAGLRRTRRKWSKPSTRFPISRMRRWSRSTRPRIGAPTASTSGWARKRPSRRSRLRPRRAGSIRSAVYVHNCFLGGGFGRRAVNDELIQAVEVSKALERPIKLIWTREAGHPLGSLPPAGGAEDARRAARRRLARPASISAPRSARSPARSAGARSRTGSSPRRSKASPTVPIAPTR